MNDLMTTDSELEITDNLTKAKALVEELVALMTYIESRV